MLYMNLAVALAIIASVLFILVCTGVIMRSIMLPADVRRAACCGACGHLVGKLASDRCPECGGEYAKVGITSPMMALRMRGSLGGAVMAWTAIVLVVLGISETITREQAMMAQWAAMAGPPIVVGGPQQVTGSMSYQPRDVLWLYRIDFDVDAIVDGASVQSGTITMTIRNSGTADASILEIRLPKGDFKLTGPDGAVVADGSAVNDAAVARGFELLGYGPEHRNTKHVIPELVRMLRAASLDPESLNLYHIGQDPTQTPLFATGNSSWSSGPAGGSGWNALPPMPAPFVPTLGAVSLLLIALLWLGGFAGIVWARRRYVPVAGAARSGAVV